VNDSAIYRQLSGKNPQKDIQAEQLSHFFWPPEEAFPTAASPPLLLCPCFAGIARLYSDRQWFTPMACAD
jgi:hypothetical protein